MKVFLLLLLLLSAVVSGESSWFSAQADETSDDEFNFSNGKEDEDHVLSIVGNDVGEWGRVYGNWCGPGYGAGKPVDELDAACKNHDECYDDKGYFDCRCDATLVQQAAASFESLEDDDAKDAASLVIDFYSNSPCLCRRSIECGFRCKTCWKWGVPYPCECEYTRCEVVVPVTKNSKCPIDED